MSHLIDEEAYRVLHANANQFDRARLLAVAGRHVGAWLQASANQKHHSDLPPPQFCVLTRFGLGLPIFSDGHKCDRCLRPSDRFGLHALTCGYSGHRGQRHDGIRDVVFHAALTPSMHVAKEPVRLLPGMQERPGDILIYGDPPEAIDFAVTHPQQPGFLAGASTTQGFAASSYARNVKHRKYRSRMEAHGYVFTAPVVATFGAWNEQGEHLIRSVIGNVGRILGIPYSSFASILFQRTYVALMRGNARALLASLGSSQLIGN